MGPLAQYLIPLAIVGAAQAVTVKGYWTDRLEIPDLLSGLALANANCCNGGTQIVTPVVQALGHQIGTAMGVCVTLSQLGRMWQTQDTACRLVLTNLLLVNATMELHDLTRSMHLPNSAGSMIFGALSGSRRKRVNEKLERRSEIEIQKSLTKVFYEEPCKGAVYATHFGLTPGTGVWVLEGSKDNHELLIKASTDASPGWNTRLKQAGAVYFDHWAEHPEIREHMMDAGHTFTEKDIWVAKAKRSVGDEPTVDDYIPPEISIKSRSPPANSQSDETSVDDSFPAIAERSTDVPEDDSFPYIAERSTDIPEDDSFPYIAERSTDQLEDDSFPWIQ
ncbi:hypothetical protein IFM46972_09445 [Aspergillus udagawae]|uniref:Uncharacterized protein n=1 Tax=Aspergillus udagawae TaxID=91492 RepID=A0A8H3S6S6_9EURO|nr:hypothetical protein IFM46972_09445 [Aspergillus udagawae]